MEVKAVFFPRLIGKPVKPVIKYIQEILKRNIPFTENFFLENNLLMTTFGRES